MMRLLILALIAGTVGGLTWAVCAGMIPLWVAPVLQGVLVAEAADVGRRGDR